MATTFHIKKGDTQPAIKHQLQDDTGTAVDISGGSVRFHLKKVGASSLKVDAAATIDDGANGKVSYSWSSGDTDTAGSYEAEWEVTYSGGGIETFPNDEDIPVKIEEDLD